MIHIDRTRVARPAFLDGKEVQTAQQKVAEYFSVPQKKRSQKTFVFPILYMATSIATALMQLFEHKCAFCESLILPDENAAAHFRPTDGAIGLDGKFSADHYWWLGFQWENLYAACSSCIRAKGLRFPVQGARAKLGEPYEKVVASESPLLLDPCIDNPTEHLVFAMNGRVSSATERGRATIEIFALNRAALVQGRRQAMRETKKLLASGDPSQLTAASLSYTAARRQVLVPARQVRGAKKVVRTASSQAAIHRDFAAYESSREEYSVEAAPSVDVSQLYFAKSRMIERIELQNIRLFSDLKIRLSPASETAPWLTLLGENGLGKSTILQAIALALMGDRLRAKFRFTPQSFLRYGEKQGAVRIYLTGVEQPIELIVTRDKFIGSDSAAKVLLLGYGSTRLFRRRGSKARGAAARHARVQNLFDPFALLKNPTTFFRGLTPDKRNAAARAAKTLLSLDDNVTIARATGERMVIVKNGTREAFDDLSDGYRTMLALASDIMAVMFDRWPDMKAAEGIVVVDELENHLHPTWKMQIVSSLRQVFPRIQFITTTHDPLCLRGLANGEVVVLQRDAKGAVFARTDDLPQVAGLRVDQLLTSEHFGLSSTVDPATEQKFERYYTLLAKPKLPRIEIKERDALKDELARLTVLGNSRRDQIALEAIDRFLARERQVSDPATRTSMRAAINDEVVQIWSGTEPAKS